MSGRAPLSRCTAGDRCASISAIAAPDTSRRSDFIKDLREGAAMVSRRAILMRKRYAQDPEYRNRKLQKVHGHVHKDEITRRRERWRDLKILQRYGISGDDRNRLLARQGGVCAICRQKTGPSARHRPLSFLEQGARPALPQMQPRPRHVR